MFVQLAEIAKTVDYVSISITSNSDGTITVNTMPVLEKKSASFDSALLEPSSLTGTAEELNAEFVALITTFQENRKSLAEQAEATESILAAAKKDSASKASKAISGGKTPKSASPAVIDSDLEPDDQEQLSAPNPTVDDLNLF